MADMLSLSTEKTGMLSLNEWQPPLAYESQAAAVDKAEDSVLLTEEYKAQQSVYEEPIQTTSLYGADFQGLLGSMAANGEEPSVAAAALADIAQKNEEFTRLQAKGEALTYIDIQNAKDPNVTAAQFRTQQRSSKAAEQLVSLAEQFSGGSFDSFMEGVDQFAYSVLMTPKNTYTGATMQGSEVTGMSQEWLAAMSTMSDEEFDTYLNTKLTDLQNPNSFLVGENQAWTVLMELQALESAGYIPGDVEGAFFDAAINVLTLDVGALVGGAKLGARAFSKIGKSAVYRTRTALGTDAATQAAIKLTPDGAPTSLRVAEDALPTAYAAPERASVPTGATGVAKQVNSPPTVSQGALQSNWLIKDIMKRQAAGSFGVAGHRDDAGKWAAEVAKAKSTNVIDINIEDDGIIGSVATITVGKPGGGSYSNFINAKEQAALIPNSELVSTKTGLVATKPIKGDTYAIRFQERRAYSASPLDVTTLKDRGRLFTGVANWVGSNGMDSVPFFNDLMYAADAGGAKFKHDIEDRLKAFGTLKSEEQGATSAILQGIQDNGKRNTWLNSAEFSAEYASLTGKAPRKEVIRVYEDTVAASDAAWFVQADKELHQFAKTGMLVFKDKKDFEHMLYPYKGNVDAKVMNGSTGAMMDSKDVPEGAVVYKFLEGKKGRPRYAYNVVGKTRLPKEADALPYNAGGPRSNPHLAYFVGTMDDGWQTLIGTTTEKQAKSAAGDYNKIQAIFTSLKKEIDLANPLDGLSPAEIKLLDDAVLANNKWNPNLETWKEFAEFIDGRGLSIKNKIIFKERNAKLEVFEDFGEDFVMRKDLGKYITYARHDQHLLEYGGVRTYNPNPAQAINAQLNRSIDQAARLQWEQTHVESWAAALHKYADSKNGGEVLQLQGYNAIFTGATLARNVVIEGNTQLARLLRREQSTIVRRLQALEGSTSESRVWRGLRNGPTQAANWAMEAIYDSEFDFLKGRFVNGIRELRDGTSGALLSFGFMTKMAAPAQFIMQGMSAVQTIARSPRNGFKGAFLAGYIREMSAHKHGPSLLLGLRKQLAKVGGMSDAQLDDLIEHFEVSGRGFAKGAVVEDPQALPGVRAAGNKVTGALKFGADKALDLARRPFYAGENYSQTVGRITAYLDTIDSYPTLNTKSKEFWGAVTTRDRSLNMNLNTGSASMAQKDSTVAVWTQWTSWSFRAMQTLFFDDTLSAAERVRFAASLTVLWGYAGMGLPNQWFGDDDNSGAMAQLLKYGPVDYMLKETIGVTLGDRVALNIPSLLARVGLSATDPLESAPSVNIAVTAVKGVAQAAVDLVNGRPMLAAYDLATLVRTFKIVDDATMAVQMLIQEERVTASGAKLPANWTTAQAFMQAIGFRPVQVTEFNSLKYSSLARQNDRKFKAVDKAVPSIKLATKYADEGDWENAQYYMLEAASIIDAYGLSETYRAEAVQSAITKAGADDVSRTVLAAIRAGLGKDALTLMESTQ